MRTGQLNSVKKRLDQLGRPTEMELRDWLFLKRKTLGSKFVKIDELDGFFLKKHLDWSTCGFDF